MMTKLSFGILSGGIYSYHHYDEGDDDDTGVDDDEEDGGDGNLTISY